MATDHTHAYTHARTRAHTCAHTHIHAHTRTHTHAHTCTHTPTHMHPHPHMCAHTQECTHAPSHAHTHIHTTWAVVASVGSGDQCGQWWPAWQPGLVKGVWGSLFPEHTDGALCGRPSCPGLVMWSVSPSPANCTKRWPAAGLCSQTSTSLSLEPLAQTSLCPQDSKSEGQGAPLNLSKDLSQETRERRRRRGDPVSLLGQ